MLIDIATRGFSLFVLFACYQFRFISLEQGLLYWLLLIVFQDFMFYVLHYVDHKVRLFWAIHVTHHSSDEFNLTVGFRSSVLQPLYRFVYFIPLVLLDFRPEDVYLVYALSQTYGILLHTRYFKSWGFLDYILVTPAHNRVHHGSNEIYVDKNMGMLLIIWDRIFGTFQAEVEPVVYGITKPIPDRSVNNLVFVEWKELWADLKTYKGLKNRLKLIFGKPGWKPSTD